jgi:hypothetical protein
MDEPRWNAKHLDSVKEVCLDKSFAPFKRYILHEGDINALLMLARRQVEVPSEDEIAKGQKEWRDKWAAFCVADDGACQDTPDEVFEFGFESGVKWYQSRLQPSREGGE